MKLDKKTFDSLVDIALATRDYEYLKELLDKQEKGTFFTEEDTSRALVPYPEREILIKEIHSLMRAIDRTSVAQYYDKLDNISKDTEDNVIGRYELLFDTISNLLIQSDVRFQEIMGRIQDRKEKEEEARQKDESADGVGE